MKKIKDQSNNVKNRRSGKIESRNFEAYKNAVRPHDLNVHNTESDISISKICHFTSVHHALTHWKCMLSCYDKVQVLSHPVMRQIEMQETYVQQYFSCLQNASHCTLNGKRPCKE